MRTITFCLFSRITQTSIEGKKDGNGKEVMKGRTMRVKKKDSL